MGEGFRKDTGHESGVVRPSAHPRVRKLFVKAEARASRDGCWRRSTLGEVAFWKVIGLMSGGVATRS
jgi:hypothetical protein